MKYNGVHSFLKDISPKVNAEVRLEFEHANYNIAIQYLFPLP